jgi:ATP-dependent protease HslVU (ClpYQ) peptidase subunit
MVGRRIRPLTHGKVSNMTAIVGVADKGKVWIGGDSAGLAGWTLQVRTDRKVFKNGEFLIGFTTSFRMGQILAYGFTPPKRPVEKDVMHFMVTDFIDALRACLKSAGYAKKENEKESAGEFLIGYAGRLFNICEDYQVGENAAKYAACGCGMDIAHGALHALSDMPARERIKAALAAAEAHSGGVRGPFHIESI